MMANPNVASYMFPTFIFCFAFYFFFFFFKVQFRSWLLGQAVRTDILRNRASGSLSCIAKMDSLYLYIHSIMQVESN